MCIGAIYEDNIAADPRIDVLRDKIVCVGHEVFTLEAMPGHEDVDLYVI